MTAKVMFAALPLRAIGDGRLSALDLRVLACVAFHDRMSDARGKGQGAWASNETLAQRVGCHYTNLSTAITRLGKFGYIQREAHPLNKRLRVYRVIYEDSAADSLPGDKQSADDAETIVCDPANAGAEIVCLASRKAAQSQQDDPVEYISLSDVRYSAKQEIDSAKLRIADATRAASVKRLFREREPIAETCAKFDREWKRDWLQFRGNLDQWLTYFDQASETYADDEAIAPWTRRLAEMIAEKIDYIQWENSASLTAEL